MTVRVDEDELLDEELAGWQSQEVEKRPFDIDVAMDRIRVAVQPYPKAAMFELAELGFTSAFEQLVACIISIRTRDEVMLPVAQQLFAVARTPAALAALTPERINELIGQSTFHESKSYQIHEIALRVVEKHGGELPCDEETLLSFRGVGPKCANLVLGIACDGSKIGVDIHVHRVTNRWGYVQATTPERTMAALEAKLPGKYRVEINQLLVPFGKHVCTGALPKCSVCPVQEMCQQVGVTKHR
jgi:endonuclease-3